MKPVTSHITDMAMKMVSRPLRKNVLNKIKKENNMKKYLVIIADYNDGDCISSKKEISDKKLLELEPVFKVLKAQQELTSHNWETDECSDKCTPKKLYIKTGKLTEEQVDLLDEYLPSGEYGIHTIQSIELIEVVNEIKLL